MPIAAQKPQSSMPVEIAGPAMRAEGAREISSALT
jgi:hypothetical protein